MNTPNKKNSSLFIPLFIIYVLPSVYLPKPKTA